jgi:hypothetical protein
MRSGKATFEWAFDGRTMSNKSAISAQVISLPTKGGALNGIDETFAPDLRTRTVTSTVLIALPADAMGFSPS